MVTRIILILSLLVQSGVALSQSISQGKSGDETQHIFTIPHEGIETEAAFTFAAEKISGLHANGFLRAVLDSISVEEKVYKVYISPGREFFYQINKLEVSQMGLTQIKNLLSAEKISFTDFNLAMEKILRYYSNNGYPFARIHKENLVITDSLIFVDLVAEPGIPVVFENVRIAGDVNLNPVFLENYLGISYGSFYNESLVIRAEKKLRELEFLNVTAPLQLSFSPGYATLTLPLAGVQSNRFDGIAGLSGGGETESPLRVTGLLNLHLANTLSMGEKIDLSWQAPGGGTQILNLNGSYPYPVGLPLETSILFSLHKQDSSWLQVQYRPTLFFSIGSNTQLGAYWQYTSNSLINTRQWQSSSTLPPNPDLKVNSYGLELQYRTMAFHRQPLQDGFLARLTGSAGNRQILKNSNLPDELYDDIILKNTHLQLNSHLQKRWLTGPRTTVGLGLNSGFINGSSIPGNLLFRLGGIRTVRGFDELSLIASSYAIGDAEIRLFTAAQSYFNIFGNGGWYEQKGRETYFNDLVLGFGTGLNLQTAAGLFSISAAMGTRRNVPLNYQNIKIHIGYLSTF